MQTWAWILIIVLGILVLGGIGTGLYFAFRKKAVPPPPPQNSNGGGDNSNGGGDNSNGGGDNSNGGGSDGGGNGANTKTFSFRPYTEQGFYVTVGPEISNRYPLVIDNVVKPCREYLWSYGTYESSSKSISNALIFQGGVSPRDAVIGGDTTDTSVSSPSNLSGYNVAWNYNPVNYTWCQFDNPYVCLYYNAKDGTVETRALTADWNFAWVNEPQNPSFCTL